MNSFYHIFKRQLTIIIFGVLLVSNVGNGIAQTTLFSETFEGASSVSVPTSSSGYNGWRRYTITAGTTDWDIWNGNGRGCVLSGSWSAMICSDAYYCHYGSNSNQSAYYASNNILYHAVTTTGYTSIKINFKWIAGGETGYDYGKVCWSTDASTWTDLSATYISQSTIQTVTDLALPAGADNQATLYVGWRWKNDNSNVASSAKGFSIDDISVTGGASCSGTPAAPVNAAASSVTTTSFIANWAASSGANTYYLDVSTVSNFASFVSGYNNKSVGNVITATVSGLSANTDYYYRVRAACTGTSSSSGNITLTTSPNYCTPTVSNYNFNITWNFSTTGGVTNITNNSKAGTGSNYNYYSAMNLTIAAGATFNLIVGGKGTTGVGFRIWIDYNGDGDFADAGESVFTAGVGTNTGYTGSVIVPASASLGVTRLRIRSSDAIVASTQSCGNTSYGEINDYNVTITTPAGASYGIYAPGGVSGISDCEIYAQGGSGTNGCLVCSPSNTGYTNVNISSYPIITATNISCTNKNLTVSTSASSATWSGTTPIGGSGTSTSVTYTATGRKNITLNTTPSCAGVTSTTATPNATLVDNACASGSGVSSNIVISGYTGCTINTGSITVKVNVTHAKVGDVMLYLIAPNGNVLTLSTHNGSGSNYTNTIFSDGGSTNITSGASPFSNTYKPEGSMGASPCKTPTVATFAAIAGAGYNPNGTWTLFASDATSTTSGTFVNWTLTLPAATGSGSSSTYTGFTNMMMASPSSGTVSGTANGCPGSYAYASSTAGTPGFTYAWVISPTTGVTITSPNSSSTNITFPTTSTTYTVTCTPSSECCGALTAVTYTTTIIVPPTPPTASANNSTPCSGGRTVLTATAPANASYAWYDAATGGNLLGTGISYSIPAVANGLTTYYVEAVNVSGCASATRTAIPVTGTITATPAATGSTQCGAGGATVNISSPVAGYTYTWYTGSCGGSQVQSNTGTSYTSHISATTTYYVTATAPGCTPSACATISATVNALPTTLTWTGSVGGANNWFNTANWGGCLPSCGSNVTIPSTANNPDIGFNAAGGAACNSITIQNGSTLSFSDAKAELSICGNFTQTGTFTSGNKGIVIFNGTLAQTYSKTGSGNLNDVVLNNTGGTPTLTLSNDMTLGATGSFTFQSGIVVTGSNNLIISNIEGQAMSGHSANSYVLGNLRRYINNSAPTSYDFPVGHSTKGYQLANVNFTTAPTTITYLTANFNTYVTLPNALGTSECSATYNQSALNNGYWDISANNSQNNTGLYNMTLYNTNYSNAYSGFTIMSRHNGSSTWGLLNGDGSSGAGCGASPVTAVVRNSMKGFSKFGVAQTLTVLPIELLSFDAVYNGKSTDVKWTTASEKNNNYFNVERSTDARNFIVVGKISSKAKGGNSVSQLSYLLNDVDVKAGTYYYRLKQIDFDGKYFYSEIAVVTIADEALKFSITPNPTEGDAQVSFESNSTEIADLKVYDTRGRLVLSKLMVSSKGMNRFFIDISNETRGMFYVVMQVGTNTYHAKLLKN